MEYNITCPENYRAHSSCMHVGDDNLCTPDCYGWVYSASHDIHEDVRYFHTATPLNPLKDTILPWILDQIGLKIVDWKLYQFHLHPFSKHVGLIQQQENTTFHFSMVPIEYPSRDQWPVGPIDDFRRFCTVVLVRWKWRTIHDFQV